VDTLLYVYCAVEGTPGDLPAATMPHGAPPRTLRLGDQVSLIVADVPRAVYAPEVLEPKLADLDWVSAAGAAHHAIVDALADGGLTVLPFRLFTIFSSDAKALSILEGRRQEMAHVFERIRGRQEWVLRIGKPDPSRVQQETSLPAPKTSGTNFLQAKADARRASAARATRVKEDAAAAFSALQQLAEVATSRPVDAAGTLLLDAAFLVTPSSVETMRATLTREAQRLLQDGCTVSLTGPWPPYSFAAMEHARG
jgi:hypothetical protein